MKFTNFYSAVAAYISIDTWIGQGGRRRGNPKPNEHPLQTAFSSPSCSTIYPGGSGQVLKNKNKFNLQEEHIYICCYSKQNNVEHVYNNTASLGRALLLSTFTCRWESSGEDGSGSSTTMGGGSVSGELRLLPSRSHKSPLSNSV